MVERQGVTIGATRVDAQSHVAGVEAVLAKIAEFHIYDAAAEAAFRARRLVEARHLDGQAYRAVGIGMAYSQSHHWIG